MGGVPITVGDRTVKDWEGLTDTMFVNPMTFRKHGYAAGLTEEHRDRACVGRLHRESEGENGEGAESHAGHASRIEYGS